jgi:hypothetical protein
MDPFNQGAYMTEKYFENLMDQGSADPTSFPSERLEEYKQRKMEREAEETLEMDVDDTVEMEI